MPCWKHTIVSIATQQLSKHYSTTSPNPASNSHCPQRCCRTTLPSHSFPTKHTCTRGFSPPRGLLHLPACLGSGLASEQQWLTCLLQPFTKESAAFLLFSSAEPFFEKGPDSAAQQTKIQQTSANCMLSPGLTLEPRECWQAKPVRINLRRVEMEGTETTDWFLPSPVPRRLTASSTAETDVTAGCWCHVTRDQLALSPPWTTQGLTTFQERQKEKGSSKWLRLCFQTGYVKSDMLSLIWLNSFLDYFGHPHKQPPIVLFHGLTLMLFKHWNQLPVLSTIPYLWWKWSFLLCKPSAHSGWYWVKVKLVVVQFYLVSVSKIQLYRVCSSSAWAAYVFGSSLFHWLNTS